MTGSPDDVGTRTWVERTGGLLTGAERRVLLRPLASAHVTNAVGRLSMLVVVNAGRRARVAAGRLRRPDSVLTRAAEAEARRRLTPALLNHSYHTFAFGSALGALENLDVDGEVLFAAALLHDVGWSGPRAELTSPEPASRSPATSRRTPGSPPPPRTRCGPLSPCTTARA